MVVRETGEVSVRRLKVARIIKDGLTSVLSRKLVISSPVTISDVVLSPDLKIAKIFVKPLYNTDRAIVEELNFQSSYIKKNLSKLIYLRYMPKISFFYDESYDLMDRVNQAADCVVS